HMIISSVTITIWMPEIIMSNSNFIMSDAELFVSTSNLIACEAKSIVYKANTVISEPNLTMSATKSYAIGSSRSFYDDANPTWGQPQIFAQMGLELADINGLHSLIMRPSWSVL